MATDSSDVESATDKTARPFSQAAVRSINDRQFFRKVRLIQRNIDFLLDRNVLSDKRDEPDNSAYKLGSLANLKYSIFGKPPTTKDWGTLEYRLDRLQSLFDEDLRREWRLLQTKGGLIFIPIGVLIWVFLSVTLQAAYQPVGWGSLVFFEMWISGLGALGALGFIAVNSLSIQNDATFDLSDARLVGGRISLGAVFGSVLSLPYCFDAFVKFGAFAHSIADKGSGEPFDAKLSAKIIAPLLLGFSTSLVLTILSRFVVAVAALFGVESVKSTAGARVPTAKAAVALPPKTDI